MIVVQVNGGHFFNKLLGGDAWRPFRKQHRGRKKKSTVFIISVPW